MPARQILFLFEQAAQLGAVAEDSWTTFLWMDVSLVCRLPPATRPTELAKVFKCDVNSLPLALDISWCATHHTPHTTHHTPRTTLHAPHAAHHAPHTTHHAHHTPCTLPRKDRSITTTPHQPMKYRSSYGTMPVPRQGRLSTAAATVPCLPQDNTG